MGWGGVGIEVGGGGKVGLEDSNNKYCGGYNVLYEDYS